MAAKSLVTRFLHTIKETHKYLTIIITYHEDSKEFVRVPTTITNSIINSTTGHHLKKKACIV